MYKSSFNFIPQMFLFVFWIILGQNFGIGMPISKKKKKLPQNAEKISKIIKTFFKLKLAQKSFFSIAL